MSVPFRDRLHFTPASRLPCLDGPSDILDTTPILTRTVEVLLKEPRPLYDAPCVVNLNVYHTS